MLFLFVLVKERKPFVGRRIKIQAAHGLSVIVVYEYGEIGLCVPVGYAVCRDSVTEYGLDDVERLQFFLCRYNFRLVPLTSFVCSSFGVGSAALPVLLSFSLMAAFRRSEIISLM